MAEDSTETITMELPRQTLDRLRRYAAARNGPIDNAASTAINAGIDVALCHWPNLREQVDGEQDEDSMPTGDMYAPRTAGEG